MQYANYFSTHVVARCCLSWGIFLFDSRLIILKNSPAMCFQHCNYDDWTEKIFQWDSARYSLKLRNIFKASLLMSSKHDS